jgi:hypothetical protein
MKYTYIINKKVLAAILLAALLTFGLAPLAQGDAGVQIATITLNTDPAPPGSVDNGGTGIESFSWSITYDSTPIRYFFQVWDNTDTPITTHNNTSQFPPAEIIVSNGTVTTFANRIEVDISSLPTGGTVTGSCKWHIPMGYPTGGFFRGHVEYYSEETPNTYEAQATTTFLVTQVIGNLRIFKYNDQNKNGVHDAGEPGLQNWHFTVVGPDNFVADTDATGYITRMVRSGNYTVTETLQSGWVCSDPGPGLQDTVDVPAGGTGEVDFGNYLTQALIRIFKYNDRNQNGQWDVAGGEEGLPGWQFAVTGPTPFTALTDATGWISRSVNAGSYNVTETLKSGWTCSDPGPTLTKGPIVVADGGTAEVRFGNYTFTPPPPPTPTLTQWGIITMAVLFTGCLVWIVRRKVAAGNS